MQTIRRRSFIAITAGAALTPLLTWAADEVPSLLDHVLLGCNDLDGGMDFVEERTGVRPAIGGVHPGRGTRNALLSLGERRYLEIIAPDPKQERIEPFAQKQVTHLKGLTSPHLIGWAAHPGDLERFAARLREANIPFDGPRAGSRQRPDGKLLQWKTLNLKDDKDGLLPFFIEWSSDSLHPRTPLKGVGSLISEDLLQIQTNSPKSLTCCNSIYPSPAVTSPHLKPLSLGQRVS